MWSSKRSVLCFVFVLGWVFFGSWLDAGVSSASPIRETRAVFNDVADNRSDADDPAIWVNAANPRRSLVIGTLKRGGLDVYDLEGKLLQHMSGDAMPPDMQLRSARYNNVDIIYGFKVGGKRADLAVVTDRHNDLLRFFALDPHAVERGRAPLTEVTAPGAPRLFSADTGELKAGKTAYGLAVTQSEPNHETAHAFVSRSGQTTIARVKVFSDNGRVAYSIVTRFDLPDAVPLPNGGTWQPCLQDEGDKPQVEGMVVDDFHRVLYLAQERVGIWKTDIDQESPQMVLLDKVKGFGVPFKKVLDPGAGKVSCQPEWSEGPGPGFDRLTADVEGLTIYDKGKGRGYLLASSQGADEFVVYDRTSGAYLGKFAIRDGVIDGSEQCDGAHVVSANLGGELSDGLLVVQDGRNTPAVVDQNGMERDNTNFKFIRWADVARTLRLTDGRPF
jgi:3-phytase